MAICNYIIKNPSGEDIIIPADFGLLVNNAELKNAYLKAVDGDTTLLLNKISEKINGSMSELDINSAILENISNLDAIVNTLNEAIPQNKDYGTFEQALYKHLLRTKDSNPGEVSDIKASLDVPITIDYHKGLAGLLTQTSVKNEHLNIRASLKEMSNFGVYSDALKELNTFLDAFKKHDRGLYNSNVVLSNESSLGVHSSNVENFTIVNKNDPTSLFLGLFKRIGNTIPVDVLNGEFGVSDYFQTKLVQGEVVLSEFELDLMDTSQESSNKIKRAIELISSSISDSPSLIDTIYKLVDYLDLSATLIAQDGQINTINKLLESESKFETDFKANRMGETLKKINSDLDSFYGTEGTVSRDLYNFIDTNLIVGEDLIYFEETGDYALLTEYKKYGDDKVYVRGMRRVGETNEYISQEVFVGESLKYRIKERNVLDPYIKGDKINPKTDNASVKSRTGFSENLLKSLLKKGDIINNDHVVGGIYPTYIMAGNLKTGKIVKINYNQISSFSSEFVTNINTDWADYNHLETINDMSTLSQGDVVRDSLDNNTIKTVLDSTDTHVYVARGEIVVAIAKEDIKAARLNSIAQIDASDRKSVLLESNRSIGENSNFSKFTNANSARKGDYFISMEGDIGLIVDEYSGKSIVFKSGEYYTTSHQNMNVKSYFTNRSLISNYSPTSIRVNSSKIHTDIKNVSNPENFVKAIYVVPKNTTQNSMYLFPSNYANIGKWKPASEFNSSSEQDFTKFMIKSIAKQTNININNIDPHLERKNAIEFAKDRAGIEEVIGYEKLSSEVRRVITPLDVGTHFNLFQEGNISENIYTVVEDLGDSVVAEVSKTNSKGDILTSQETFSKEELLSKNTETGYGKHNSISNLYFKVGDPTNIVVARAAEADLTIEDIEQRNSIEDLKTQMRKTFKRIGMEVTEDTEGFQEGQKAKIHTSIDSDGKHKTAIVLNTTNGDYSDLVHENLHIQLILLRYNDIQQYNNLINSLVNTNEAFLEKYGIEADLSTKEEFVVDELVKLSNGENNFIYGNLNGFMDAVHKIMTKHFGGTYDFDISKNISNNIEFLNTPMREFYRINAKGNSHPLYNMGILAAEPILREWMQKNNIKIIC